VKLGGYYPAYFNKEQIDCFSIMTVVSMLPTNQSTNHRAWARHAPHPSSEKINVDKTTKTVTLRYTAFETL